MIIFLKELQNVNLFKKQLSDEEINFTNSNVGGGDV